MTENVRWEYTPPRTVNVDICKTCQRFFCYARDRAARGSPGAAVPDDCEHNFEYAILFGKKTEVYERDKVKDRD